jgi:hypothetical protein
MWALMTLCFAMSDCNVKADPQVLMVFYTRAACHTYGEAVVEDKGYVYFCADARDVIVED